MTEATIPAEPWGDLVAPEIRIKWEEMPLLPGDAKRLGKGPRPTPVPQSKRKRGRLIRKRSRKANR